MILRNLAALALLALPAGAQTILTVEPFTGSEPMSEVAEAFGKTERITGFADGQIAAEPFSGRVTLGRFRNPEGVSTLEIVENYRTALEGRGFVPDWECSGRDDCGNQRDGGWNSRNGMNLGTGRDVRYLTGRVPHEGVEVLVSVGVEPRAHYVQVLQPEALETGRVRVLDAEAMATALEAEGRLAIDNIYFDFGKADLLPESDAALTEIARLLSGSADLAVYVVGHTDAVGSLEANLDLSRRRAEAVVAALAARHGVAEGRAVPAGVGPLAPVATNATDAGRALNRRVEIVARPAGG
jgi:outer membrane protein OmpA-like peptidoglycan-associated protein